LNTLNPATESTCRPKTHCHLHYTTHSHTVLAKIYKCWTCIKLYRRIELLAANSSSRFPETKTYEINHKDEQVTSSLCLCYLSKSLNFPSTTIAGTFPIGYISEIAIKNHTWLSQLSWERQIIPRHRFLHPKPLMTIISIWSGLKFANKQQKPQLLH
jgi:hypothetical protein